MVQVVDPVPDPSVVKYTLCRHCGVRLSYVPADVKKDYTTDYLGSRGYYYYIDCPKCTNQVCVG